MASRWALHLQAQTLRRMTDVGMAFHRFAPPRPREPAFTKTIPSTISPHRGNFDLVFYTPDDYRERPPGKRYPLVVNFHGGGFTIGRATDDARWADALVNDVDTVVVSVDYRLGPEYPFPTAVEDAADALLFLFEHAQELGIDETKVVTSGFSAGGNLSFTAPLRAQAELRRRMQQHGSGGDASLNHLPNAGKLAAILSWYPSTDFATHTRAERRASNLRVEKELPKIYSDLFDASYLPPDHGIAMSDPYLSPALAPADMLRDLPEQIIIYTCEWDELLLEAERFRDRLVNEIGKKVTYRKVIGTAHAFDKTLNPFRNDQTRIETYREACSHLRRALDGQARGTTIEDFSPPAVTVVPDQA